MLVPKKKKKVKLSQCVPLFASNNSHTVPNLLVDVPEAQDHDASWTARYFSFAAGSSRQVPPVTSHTPPCRTSGPSGHMHPPDLQREQRLQRFSVCLNCQLSIPLLKEGEMWHFSSSGGPFECDIEKSLMADFALSGELIHTRWFSLLVERKPDTKTEMKSLRCRTGLHMCGRVCVGVSVFFLFFFLFLL